MKWAVVFDLYQSSVRDSILVHVHSILVPPIKACLSMT